MTGLYDFICESNAIEGIERDPTAAEEAVHLEFLALIKPLAADVEKFVGTVAGAQLGMDVYVGEHRPPRGSPHMRVALERLLAEVRSGSLGIWETHVRYEHLHPFTDGNGRSGRVLWAWQMLRAGRDPFELPFLHCWYYQSLQAAHGGLDRAAAVAMGEAAA